MLEIIKANMIPFVTSIVVSLTTVLLTEWIKKRGNLKIYIIDYKEEYYTYDDKNRCDTKEKMFTRDTNRVQITVTIDIHNNTSIPKIMRNIKLKIENNDKIIINDKDTESFRHSMYHIEELNNLNINSFTVVRKTITVSLSRNNYIKTNKYNLIYRNNNDKLKKVKFTRLVENVNNQ